MDSRDKHDGYRTVLVLDRGSVRAFTRNGHDWSDGYPAIVASVAELRCRSAILDGEVIVQDGRGAADFEALQRALRGRPHSLIFSAFDVLHLDGNDLRDLPLVERRARLKKLIGDEGAGAANSARSSSATLPRSSGHAPSTSLKASSLSWLFPDIIAAALAAGSRQSALPRAS